MSTAYTKHSHGDKLFTVEWNLALTSPAVSEVGDAFEAVDCELVSIHATTSGTVSSKLSFGNKATADVPVSLSAGDGNVIMFPPLPPVRFYTPAIEDGDGGLALALLFREI